MQPSERIVSLNGKEGVESLHKKIMMLLKTV
jgi:hypothetical protein